MCIRDSSTPQALQAVKNGEVDFAIITTPAEVESGLKMVELKPFYEVLVGGRTFTALASQNLSLKELNNYCLLYTSGDQTPALIMLPLYNSRRTLPVTFSCVEVTKALRALRRGLNHWPS